MLLALRACALGFAMPEPVPSKVAPALGRVVCVAPVAQAAIAPRPNYATRHSPMPARQGDAPHPFVQARRWRCCPLVLPAPKPPLVAIAATERGESRCVCWCCRERGCAAGATGYCGRCWLCVALGLKVGSSGFLKWQSGGGWRCQCKGCKQELQTRAEPKIAAYGMRSAKK